MINLFDMTNMTKRKYIAWNIWAIIQMSMIIIGIICIEGMKWMAWSIPIFIAFYIVLYNIRKLEKQRFNNLEL